MPGTRPSETLDRNQGLPISTAPLFFPYPCHWGLMSYLLPKKPPQGGLEGWNFSASWAFRLGSQFSTN